MADQGFGLTVTFSSGFLAEVLSFTWDGVERAAIDTTHMTTTNGWMTFLASDLKNPGQATIEIQFVANTLFKTPLTASAATVTATYPIPAGGSVAATRAASGFLMSFSHVVPHDDKMTATVVIKFSGEITETAGS